MNILSRAWSWQFKSLLALLVVCVFAGALYARLSFLQCCEASELLVDQPSFTFEPAPGVTVVFRSESVGPLRYAGDAPVCLDVIGAFAVQRNIYGFRSDLKPDPPGPPGVPLGFRSHYGNGYLSNVIMFETGYDRWREANGFDSTDRFSRRLDGFEFVARRLVGSSACENEDMWELGLAPSPLDEANLGQFQPYSVSLVVPAHETAWFVEISRKKSRQPLSGPKGQSVPVGRTTGLNLSKDVELLGELMACAEQYEFRDCTNKIEWNT